MPKNLPKFEMDSRRPTPGKVLPKFEMASRMPTSNSFPQTARMEALKKAMGK